MPFSQFGAPTLNGGIVDKGVAEPINDRGYRVYASQSIVETLVSHRIFLLPSVVRGRADAGSESVDTFPSWRLDRSPVVETEHHMDNGRSVGAPSTARGF